MEANDHYYRQRLRALQSIDEMIEAIVLKLEEHDIIDNTYIVFTTDNGFHVGQHRLEPGKYCPFEEDVHVPLFIRGPGVPVNEKAEIVTTHTDLAPTFLSMIGAPLGGDLDVEAIPLTKKGIEAAVGTRFEHFQVEYWGFALSEGKYRYPGMSSVLFVFIIGPYSNQLVTRRKINNNTYKALRIVSEEYSIYYSIWCNNEHELYNMKVSNNSAIYDDALLMVKLSRAILTSLRTFIQHPQLLKRRRE